MRTHSRSATNARCHATTADTRREDVCANDQGDLQTKPRCARLHSGCAAAISHCSLSRCAPVQSNHSVQQAREGIRQELHGNSWTQAACQGAHGPVRSGIRFRQRANRAFSTYKRIIKKTSSSKQSSTARASREAALISHQQSTASLKPCGRCKRMECKHYKSAADHEITPPSPHCAQCIAQGILSYVESLKSIF